MPTESRAKIVKGLLILISMSSTNEGKCIPKIFKLIEIINAMKGGNFMTFLLISFTEGVVEEYHEATATPNVIPIKNEPAWLIKIAICNPSFPYNISKMGNPKNEVLLMPPVIINAAMDFDGAFIHLPIMIKSN